MNKSFSAILAILIFTLLITQLISCSDVNMDQNNNPDPEIIYSNKGIFGGRISYAESFEQIIDEDSIIIKGKVVNFGETILFGKNTIKENMTDYEKLQISLNIVTPAYFLVDDVIYGNLKINDTITIIEGHGIYQGFENDAGVPLLEANTEYILVLQYERDYNAYIMRYQGCAKINRSGFFIKKESLDPMMNKDVFENITSVSEVVAEMNGALLKLNKK